MLLTVPATPIGESLTLQTFRAEDAAALPGPEWLRERRVASHAAFASTALPTESEEVWRYSPIDELDLDRFAPATTPGDTAGAAAGLASAVSALGSLSGQVLVHNGQPGDFESDGEHPAFGFGGTADIADAEHMVGHVQVGGDALVLLNDAFFPDAVLIDVPAGVVVPHPILVMHWCDQDEDESLPNAAAFPRTSVRLGTNAQASVVEIYAGPAGLTRSLVVPVTELEAGDGASLSYVSLQILNEAAWSLARLAARGDKTPPCVPSPSAWVATTTASAPMSRSSAREPTARSSRPTSGTGPRSTTFAPCRTTWRPAPPASCCARERWPGPPARSTAA